MEREEIYSEHENIIACYLEYQTQSKEALKFLKRF